MLSLNIEESNQSMRTTNSEIKLLKFFITSFLVVMIFVIYLFQRKNNNN